MMKVESLVGCTLNNGQKYFQNVWALPGHELTVEQILQTSHWVALVAGGRLRKLEHKVAAHDQAIVSLVRTTRELMSPLPEQKKRSIGFISDKD